MAGDYGAPSRSWRLSGRRLDLACALLLAVGAFGLYAVTAVPGVFDGDYGEFQYMPRLLGLPHPTGYPSFLLLGWLWSWLPLGSMAFRLNLFSAFWAAVTLVLLYLGARGQGLKRISAMAGSVTLGLAPAFWRHTGVAAVYTLNTALLAGALICWLQWSKMPSPADRKWLWAAALTTGLALTNHPTAAFLVPAAALFALVHWLPWKLPSRFSSEAQKEPLSGPAKRLRVRELLAAAGFFVLPGLLYLYVPLRVCALGLGDQNYSLPENIAKGLIAPYVSCNAGNVVEYITGRSFLMSYGIDLSLLWRPLPGLLVEQFGLPLVLIGALGLVVWLVRRPRSWLLLAALFVPAALYAMTYYAEYSTRDEIVHLEGFLLPALLVFALWIAQGASSAIRAALRVWPRPQWVNGLTALLLVLAFGVHLRGGEAPTSNMRVQSRSIDRYWSEVLSYPLEAEVALTGHWGDLTAFWYFQHGEGLRPDLWGIYPPSVSRIDEWLTESGRPIYLAGPVLDWNPQLATRYDLTPWGVLVRITRPGDPPALPPMTARSEVFGQQLQLEGYDSLSPEAGREQIWLAWQTIAPTRRDLSISVRLHSRGGPLLVQKDGRLASLWYPNGTLPAGQPFLTALELEVPEDLPPGMVVRIVVYDPGTMQPLLTTAGRDVFELGPLQ